MKFTRTESGVIWIGMQQNGQVGYKYLLKVYISNIKFVLYSNQIDVLIDQGEIDALTFKKYQLMEDTISMILLCEIN